VARADRPAPPRHSTLPAAGLEPLLYQPDALQQLSLQPVRQPGPAEGRLTKEQYLDYIDRAEQRLGLAGQPRAVVFHIKKDKNGVSREHCHVVWSRFDAERGKAVHIAFDHDKLMMVTREFAATTACRCDRDLATVSLTRRCSMLGVATVRVPCRVVTSEQGARRSEREGAEARQLGLM
jgi:relaxase-like protein